MLEFLWRAGAAHAATRATSTLVELTLEHMCEGGIYDHLGGGFSRYSVDERWLVPHFEKMLYDNAQLLELLALAHAAHRQRAVPRARRGNRRLARARDDDAGGRVLRLARRRLRRRGGQVLRLVAAPRSTSVLGAGRRRVLRRTLRRDAERQFRGPQHPQPAPRLPRERRTTRRGSPRCAKSCSQARGKRVRPGLDDKVLADWNGLMIAALVNAGIAARRAGLDRAWRRAPSMFIAAHDDAAATGSAIPGATASCCFPASRPTTPP